MGDITPPAALPNVEDRIITVAELADALTLNRATVWRMVKAGDFPPPIRLTPSRIGWRWSAVERWLDDREANPPTQRAYFGRRTERSARGARC